VRLYMTTKYHSYQNDKPSRVVWRATPGRTLSIGRIFAHVSLIGRYWFLNTPLESQVKA